MPITINRASVSLPPCNTSPKSVLHHSSEEIVENLVLGGGSCELLHQNNKPSSMTPPCVNEDKVEHTDCKEKKINGTENKRPRINEPWVCPASKKCRHTSSPVQSVVEKVTRRIRFGSQRADRKNPLSLASGDATAVGRMPPCSAGIEMVVKAALEKPHAAGYSDACGTLEARVAVANHHSYPEVRIGPENVIITNGCSGALALAMTSLLDVGEIVLLPQPGFPLYEEIAKSIGATVVHYHLNPERNWECDMEHLDSIMASHDCVRAMIINNPSSPTGSVFSEEHLATIAKFAQRNQIPIISDEIYGDLTFGSNKFFPMAQIAARLGRHVPVITASGISKQFLLPGWRVGWLTFHDNIHNSLWQIKTGAIRLVQLNHGTSNLAQAAIPTLLNPSTPGLIEWRETLRLNLQERSELLCGKLSRCPGLRVIAPQGAMYATIGIDTERLDVEHDLEFAMRLVDEENVFVVPGTAMGVQNIIRVSFCSPENVLDAAARRIENFCHRLATTRDQKKLHFK